MEKTLEKFTAEELFNAFIEKAGLNADRSIDVWRSDFNNEVVSSFHYLKTYDEDGLKPYEFRFEFDPDGTLNGTQMATEINIEDYGDPYDLFRDWLDAYDYPTQMNIISDLLRDLT